MAHATQSAQSSNVVRTTTEEILSGSLTGVSLLDMCLEATIQTTATATKPARKPRAKPAAAKSTTTKKPAAKKPAPVKTAPVKTAAVTGSSILLQSIYKSEKTVTDEWTEEEGEPDGEEIEVGSRIQHCGTTYIVRWSGADKKSGEPRIGLSRFSAGRIELFLSVDEISAEMPEGLPELKRGDSVEYATKGTGKVARYVVGSVRGTRVYLKFCSSKRRGFWTSLAECKPVATPKKSKRGVCVVCGLSGCNIGPFSIVG